MRTQGRLRTSVVVSVLGALCLVVAACGTTARIPKDQAAGGGLAVGGANTTVPGGADASGGGAAGTESARAGLTGSRAAGGAAAAGSGVRAAGGSATAGANSTASGSTPARGPGITATKIFIGVGYSSQSAAGDKAIGASGAAPSYDTRDVFNAVIKYANSHGGFAGRQLEALYYDYNLTTDFPTQDQSACATWTQDNKVFAIIAGTDIRDECAEKAGAVPIGGGSATASTFQKYPHLVSPDVMTMDRLGAITVNGLHAAGYFEGKLGLVTWDDPEYRFTMTQGYFPALAAKGIKPVDTAYIMVPQQIGALGDMSSAVSAAINKFRAEGIDHVIIQDGPAGVWAGTGLTFEWMNQSKSQQYKPRYGQNAFNSPGSTILPPDQMDQAVAISDRDSDAKYDEGWHPNPSRELCFKIQSDAGFPVDSSHANDQGIAAQACDYVFFVQRVINSLSTINADAFAQAVTRLGTSFQPAWIYGSKFAGRRDGGGMVRTEDYLASCQCLKFRGPPFYAD